MNRLVRFALPAALLLAGTCSRPAPDSLNFGIIAPAFNHLPLQLALESGSTQGLKLRLYRFNSGWELGEALVAGRLDAAIIPFTYVLAARARGSDVRIVACFEREDDGIIARPGISRLEELAGCRIGCLKASTIELLLRSGLARRGIDFEPVYFSSPAEMWSALERREVDALSYYVPGIIKADGSIGKIIHWYAEDWPLHPCCDIAIHARRTRGRLSEVRRLVSLLARAAESISRDEPRAVLTASAVWGLDDSLAAECVRRTPFRVSLTAAEQEFELETGRLMHQLGYLERPVTTAEVYLDLTGKE